MNVIGTFLCWLFVLLFALCVAVGVLYFVFVVFLMTIEAIIQLLT